MDLKSKSDAELFSQLNNHTLTFAGIEAELRGIQASPYGGARVAASWWERSFAHKYPLYRYDVKEERIVRRDRA